MDIPTIRLTPRAKVAAASAMARPSAQQSDVPDDPSRRRQALLATIAEHGTKRNAADALGISLRTFYRRCAAAGISKRTWTRYPPLDFDSLSALVREYGSQRAAAKSIGVPLGTFQYWLARGRATAAPPDRGSLVYDGPPQSHANTRPLTPATAQAVLRAHVAMLGREDRYAMTPAAEWEENLKNRVNDARRRLGTDDRGRAELQQQAAANLCRAARELVTIMEWPRGQDLKASHERLRLAVSWYEHVVGLESAAGSEEGSG